jgi:hypothetical protein
MEGRTACSSIAQQISRCLVPRKRFSNGIARRCLRLDEPCDSSAGYHCGICGQWFCAIHAEDEAWHHCVLEPGDEGGGGNAVDSATQR